MRLRLRNPEGQDPPTALGATLDLPERHRRRRRRAIRPATAPRWRVRAWRRCPAGSLMGTGRCVGLADTTPARGRITVVNGGEDRVWLYTVLTNPVRQDAPGGGQADARSTAAARGSTLTFPEELQTISGVPIGLRELRLRAGRGGLADHDRLSRRRSLALQGRGELRGRHVGQLRRRRALQLTLAAARSAASPSRGRPTDASTVPGRRSAPSRSTTRCEALLPGAMSNSSSSRPSSSKAQAASSEAARVATPRPRADGSSQ